MIFNSSFLLHRLDALIFFFTMTCYFLAMQVYNTLLLTKIQTF